jgi:hypothetical protein
MLVRCLKSEWVRPELWMNWTPVLSGDRIQWAWIDGRTVRLVWKNLAGVRHGHPTSHSLIFISGARSRTTIIFLICPQSLRELRGRIRDAVMSVNEDMLCRVWYETAFRWDVCRITRGSHIERLWTTTWMSSHCCGAIRFLTCGLNKKLKAF